MGRCNYAHNCTADCQHIDARNNWQNNSKKIG